MELQRKVYSNVLGGRQINISSLRVSRPRPGIKYFHCTCTFRAGASDINGNCEKIHLSKLDISLVLVSKMVSDEALEILYPRDLFAFKNLWNID